MDKTDQPINEDSSIEVENRDEVNESQTCAEESDIDLDEWELVEDDYVCLDLVGLIEGDILKKCERNQIKLIGMFEEHPVLQIGKTYFVGSQKEVIGTNVFFQIQDSVDENSDEEQFLPTDMKLTPKVKFHCMSRKKLVMEQAFIKKKNISTSQKT